MRSSDAWQDAERECACDRKSNGGQLDKAWDDEAARWLGVPIDPLTAKSAGGEFDNGKQTKT